MEPELSALPGAAERAAIEARHQARLKLVQYHAFHAERDQLMRDARACGVSVSEIARLIGMARGHVSRIINGGP